MRVDLVEFHTFLGSALGRNPVVVDLGANVGRFTEKMARRYGATCLAVEANPEIFGALADKPCRAFNLAITGASGTVELTIDSNSLASTTLGAGDGRTVTVEALDLESFCARAGIDRIDLLKVDIEGAEIGMLAACSDAFLRAIPQITIEFHDFCGLTPPRTVRACLDRMERLGFASVRLSRVGHQDTLLVRRELIGGVRLAWLRFGYRNVKGAVRMARKLVLGKEWNRGYS